MLCHSHHCKTNDDIVCTVAVLGKMKTDRGVLWADRLYELPERWRNSEGRDFVLARRVGRSFRLSDAIKLTNNPTDYLTQVTENRLVAESVS